jgi:FkbM family methyltransferase
MRGLLRVAAVLFAFAMLIAPGSSASVAGACPPKMMHSLRRINDSRLRRSAGPARKVAKCIGWLLVEARLVRESGEYVLNTLRRSRAPRRYRLRSTGYAFCLRHHTEDVAIFRKFAADRDYDFPDEIASRLKDRRISVVDLGAHIGLFGVHVRAHADVSSMVSFEPDEQNAELVEQVIREHGGAWKLIRACASNRSGETRFAGGRGNLSRMSEAGTVVPMVDAIPYLLAADLAKVNIEGAEWKILADPRFVAQAPEVLILEYHAMASPEQDFHGLVSRLLTEAGYEEQLLVNRSEANGLIWAWKPSSSPPMAEGCSESEAVSERTRRRPSTGMSPVPTLK